MSRPPSCPTKPPKLGLTFHAHIVLRALHPLRPEERQRPVHPMLQQAAVRGRLQRPHGQMRQTAQGGKGGCRLCQAVGQREHLLRGFRDDVQVPVLFGVSTRVSGSVGSGKFTGAERERRFLAIACRERPLTDLFVCFSYDLFSMDAEKDRSPVPLSEIDGTYAHQNVL
jgi:hypothetical protein